MAIYRNVQLSFWTDNKVEDDFTPEDKYFYLYLITNPQTNICGCYEVSYSQMTRQTGYNSDTINRLLDRFEKVHDVIRFNKESKEILLLNWYKYNWSKSEKTLVGVENVAKHIKCNEFKSYVYSIIKTIRNGSSEMGLPCPMVASVTDTVINNNINTQSKGIDNNTSINNGEYVDFEKIWQYTYEAYPKKSNHASAKTEWMNKLLPVVEQNRKEVSKIIWKAVKLFVADYTEKNPDDTAYRYIPTFNKWMTEDLDYWMAEVERRDNNA